MAGRGGSADIGTITHQQAGLSWGDFNCLKIDQNRVSTVLEESLGIVGGRHRWLMVCSRMGSLWSYDGQSKGCIHGGSVVQCTMCIWVIVGLLHSQLVSRLSSFGCKYTVYVVQFVPPVVILSSIYQVTNHQPPVLSGHYKGATKEEVSLKERTTQKKAKRSCPMFMNRSTQFTGKLGFSPCCLFGQFILIRAKRRRTIKL